MPARKGVYKKCDFCASEFYIRKSHSHQRFCSRLCGERDKRAVSESNLESIACPECGKDFSRHIGSDKNCCSVPCANRKRISSTPRKIRESFNCIRCNTRVFDKPSRVARAKYCSDKCKYKSMYGEHATEKRDINPKVYAIIESEKNYRFFKWLSKKLVGKFYSIDDSLSEDVLQEYLLSLIMGNYGTLENTFSSFARRELKKGVIGSHECDFSFETIDVIKEAKALSEKHYGLDLAKELFEITHGLSDIERKFFELSIKGFLGNEIIILLRKEFEFSIRKFGDMKKDLLSKQLSYSI